MANDVIRVAVDTEADLRALVLTEPDCWRTVVTVRKWGKLADLDFALVEEGAALVASAPVRVPCAFTDFAFWMAELDPDGAQRLLAEYGGPVDKILNKVHDSECDWCREAKTCAEFQLDDGDGGVFIAHLCGDCCKRGAESVETSGSRTPPASAKPEPPTEELRGWTDVRIWTRSGETIVGGTPPDDGSHNCDAMGCGSEHVAARGKLKFDR